MTNVYYEITHDDFMGLDLIIVCDKSHWDTYQELESNTTCSNIRNAMELANCYEEMECTFDMNTTEANLIQHMKKKGFNMIPFVFPKDESEM